MQEEFLWFLSDSNYLGVWFVLENLTLTSLDPKLLLLFLLLSLLSPGPGLHGRGL